MIDTKATITIAELAKYAIYNEVTLAYVAPSRYEQRMAALAFGVMCDNILPECGTYHSQVRRMDLEIGSRVHFIESSEIGRKLRGMCLHGVLFESMRETTREHYLAAQLRIRFSDGLGVRFLGR